MIDRQESIRQALSPAPDRVPWDHALAPCSKGLYRWSMPARPKAKALSVSALTRRIENSLADFGPLTVQGELSMVKVAASGHLYASLKDSDAKLDIVMWRSTVARQSEMPREGTAVEVRGSLSVYAPRGSYQLIANRISPVGAGDLAAQFEALKQKLHEAGLFADEHKQELPYLPRAVGLATASGSAALADMLHSIRERFPRMSVVHAPCLVQGPEAADSIVQALRKLDKHPEVDVIVAGRGGGSLEDLWAFNEEPVVRAIAACATPVISAVGHETDVTLADFVADQRAKTPTAAIEYAVPSATELEDFLLDTEQQLQALIDDRLNQARQRLDSYAKHRALMRPEHQLHLRQQRLDEAEERLHMATQTMAAQYERRLTHQSSQLRLLTPAKRLLSTEQDLERSHQRLQRACRNLLNQNQQRWQALAGRLGTLSPLAVLNRGYAVVRDENGTVLTDTKQLQPGKTITAQLASGQLQATVTDIRPDEHQPSDKGPSA